MVIVHPGPKKREEYKELVNEKLSKLRGFFVMFVIILPLIAYFPFKFGWIKSTPVNNPNIVAAVAKVNSQDGTGSAFLVSPTKLITARHVVQGQKLGDAVMLNFEKSDDPSNQLEAKIIFIGSNPDDLNKDYAVLELAKPLENVGSLIKGTATNVELNDQINVIGYPGGLFSSSRGYVTNNAVASSPDILQLWAGAWPGNSGGPVVLEKTNEVVGILVAGFNNELKGMTFAIKIDALLNDPEAKNIDWSK